MSSARRLDIVDSAKLSEDLREWSPLLLWKRMFLRVALTWYCPRAFSLAKYTPSGSVFQVWVLQSQKSNLYLLSLGARDSQLESLSIRRVLFFWVSVLQTQKSNLYFLILHSPQTQKLKSSYRKGYALCRRPPLGSSDCHYTFNMFYRPRFKS